jgi:DeoR family fructose operon transcriptional repressor
VNDRLRPDRDAVGATSLAPQRHQFILDELARTGQVVATQIAETLGVTHETVRKDLMLLQSEGHLRRVHGGAVGVGSLTREEPVATRTAYAQEEARIARAALDFVPLDGAIILDAGTSTAALADALPVAPALRAITNSLPIALSLLPKVGAVSLLGGRVREITQATVDQWALSAVRSVRADVAFLGANAVSIGHGLATPDEPEAAVKAALLGAARFRVLLSDHSKLGRESIYRYGELADLDVLITDTGLPSAEAEAITRATGVEVQRV